MNSELDILQGKLRSEIQARRLVENSLEKKSLELFNLRQDLKGLQNNIQELKSQLGKAEQADQLFIENISDELRTPLNAILGMTEFLESSALNEEQADQLKVLKSSAEILNNLILDILDVAILDNEEYAISNEQFDIVSLMNSLEQSFTSKLDATDVTVQLELDSGFDKLLLGDPILLKQILTKLIRNAASSTKEGYIYLRARIIDRDREKISVRFEIEDTGLGLREEDLKHVFEKLHYSNERDDKILMGRHLVAVNKIVNLLGGEIHLSSRFGAGSKFTVVLNYEETTIPLGAVKDVLQDTIEKTGFSRPILIVEDNNLNQKYLSKLFEKWNYAYRIADNGIEAIELARAETFSIILMDIQMPRMNGFEVSKVIRKMGNINSTIPIIAMSSNAASKRKNLREETGISEFLMKPFTPNQIAMFLSKYGNLKEEPANESLETKQEDFILENSAFEQTEANIISEEVGLKSAAQEIPVLSIDRAFLRSTYSDDFDQALEAFEMFIDKMPEELGSLQKSERLSQVSTIANRIKPSFQAVGLAKFSNDLSIIEELAKNGQHEELNIKIDAFLNNANEALSTVEEHYLNMKNNNSLS